MFKTSGLRCAAAADTAVRLLLDVGAEIKTEKLEEAAVTMADAWHGNWDGLKAAIAAAWALVRNTPTTTVEAGALIWTAMVATSPAHCT